MNQNKNIKLGHAEKRPYWVLLGSVFVRALHQLGAGAFLGTVLFGYDLMPRWVALLVYVSGGVLWYLEWLRHREMLRELSGLATIAKLFLIGVAVHGMLPAKVTLVVAFLLASICAHLPKNLRHRLLF